MGVGGRAVAVGVDGGIGVSITLGSSLGVLLQAINSIARIMESKKFTINRMVNTFIQKLKSSCTWRRDSNP